MTEHEAGQTRDREDHIRAPADGLRLAGGPDATVAPQQLTVDRFLDRTDVALASLDETPDALVGDAMPFYLRDFAEDIFPRAATAPSSSDEELDVTIELGRTQMFIDDFRTLRKGSIVALDNLVGEPVEIVAATQLVARGELLVLSGNFCVRVTQLVGRHKLESRTTLSEKEP